LSARHQQHTDSTLGDLLESWKSEKHDFNHANRSHIHLSYLHPRTLSAAPWCFD
jgi:hypothetical protein